MSHQKHTCLPVPDMCACFRRGTTTVKPASRSFCIKSMLSIEHCCLALRAWHLGLTYESFPHPAPTAPQKHAQPHRRHLHVELPGQSVGPLAVHDAKVDLLPDLRSTCVPAAALGGLSTLATHFCPSLGREPRVPHVRVCLSVRVRICVRTHNVDTPVGPNLVCHMPARPPTQSPPAAPRV